LSGASPSANAPTRRKENNNHDPHAKQAASGSPGRPRPRARIRHSRRHSRGSSSWQNSTTTSPPWRKAIAELFTAGAENTLAAIGCLLGVAAGALVEKFGARAARITAKVMLDEAAALRAAE
jgi:hypothetical protein